jgi:hypothetical protein
VVLISPSHEWSLGEQLERIRAEHRARRLERVLDALRARVRDYTATAVPIGLSAAVSDFERELTAVRAQLAVDHDALAGDEPVTAGLSWQTLG